MKITVSQKKKKGFAMNFMFCLITGLFVLMTGCAGPRQNTDILFQTSVIDALLAGVYDGETACGELLEHGDFGIGTFEALDGEMIILDGTVYQVKADGNVHEPGPLTKTPFATVCYFTPQKKITIESGADFKAVEALIDRAAPNQNLFTAIKITGHFKTMLTRSVPRQTKPYPPLKEITANQPEFSMQNISGTIVGFRCPPYVQGINVPGYHLHFVDNRLRIGGHILGFEIDAAKCELDVLNKYFLVLPTDIEGFAETDLSSDRSEELKKVETGKKD